MERGGNGYSCRIIELYKYYCKRKLWMGRENLRGWIFLLIVLMFIYGNLRGGV